MGVIKGAAVVVTVGAIVGLGVNAIEPHTSTSEQDRQRTVQQQHEGDAADANEQENERRRKAGDAHGDAEVDRRNRPGEVRPRDLPKVKIRFRP